MAEAQGIQLTSGSCKRLQFSDPNDDDIFETPHTIQFLSIKKVNTAQATTSSGQDRYRIIISDGEYFIQAMLATQLNDLVTRMGVGKHTIATVKKATCNYVGDKRLIILLEMEVIAKVAEKIGDPKQLAADGRPGDATSAPTPAPVAASSSSNAQRPPQPARPANQRERGIFPIEGLSPYQNNWTIKARVTQKSDMKMWSNTSGEGKLFNVTFMDETGEIRATAFNIAADEFYPRLEEGKVYYVSKARVGLAKKKFSNLPNDYELTFDSRTEVEECHDTTNLPTVKFNFVPLDGLEVLVKDSVCDVIGVVKEVSELGSITSKAQNRQITKRELTLVDRSNYSVRLTLWGNQAEQFKAEPASVIAFKGVRVGDFGGRSLSFSSASTMMVNPDIEECHKLQGWYSTQGQTQAFHAQSNANVGGTGLGFRRDEIRTLEDVKQAGFGQGDKPDFFSTRATVMHIRDESVSYPACPKEGCNKKVVEDAKGWRCEKCEQSFPQPEHRYVMSMMVADHTGKAWFQGFNDVGMAVYGMTANELLAIKDADMTKYKAIQYHASCKAYNFSCRAKEDEFNGVRRVRIGISKIYTIDYKEEAAHLRELLYSPWAR